MTFVTQRRAARAALNRMPGVDHVPLVRLAQVRFTFEVRDAPPNAEVADAKSQVKAVVASRLRRSFSRAGFEPAPPPPEGGVQRYVANAVTRESAIGLSPTGQVWPSIFREGVGRLRRSKD